jgi:hypothetical protein
MEDVGLRIKMPLTPSISPEFHSHTGRGGPPTSTLLTLFLVVHEEKGERNLKTFAIVKHT